MNGPPLKTHLDPLKTHLDLEPRASVPVPDIAFPGSGGFEDAALRPRNH